MAPMFCPACRRPTRTGLSFCTNCNYFLGQQPVLGSPVASQRQATVAIELVLVLLIAASVLVGLGVLLTSPAG